MKQTYKKLVRLLMTTMMTGGLMLTGQTGMAAPAQPTVNVDAATKDMPNHVASKVLDVKADKTEVGLISNVVYEQVPSRGYANVPMQMDILQPKTQAKKPAILFVTGGGFINANKDNGIQLRMHLAEHGYVVGSINYRVAPTAKFPEPLEDVKAAIRFLKANADRFGIDHEHEQADADEDGSDDAASDAHLHALGIFHLNESRVRKAPADAPARNRYHAIIGPQTMVHHLT